MDHYVGLDVSQEQTAVCVIDSAGEIVWQGRCASMPQAIAATVHAKRIGLKAGPLSSWHWHTLRTLGLPVICLDARHAKAALSAQVNKTDKNDAYGLAQIVRTGWYREVQVKSFDSHARRGLLTSRAQLVRMRVDLANQMRGILSHKRQMKRFKSAGQVQGFPSVLRVFDMAVTYRPEDKEQGAPWRHPGVSLQRNTSIFFSAKAM